MNYFSKIIVTFADDEPIRWRKTTASSAGDKAKGALEAISTVATAAP